MSKRAWVTYWAGAWLHEMSAQWGFILLICVTLIVLIIGSLLIASIISATVAALSAITWIELGLVVAHVILVERCIVSIEAHLGCSELREILVLGHLHLVWISTHVLHISKLSHKELCGVHASSHWHLYLLTVVVLLLVLYQMSKDLHIKSVGSYLHPFKLFLILIIIT